MNIFLTFLTGRKQIWANGAFIPKLLCSDKTHKFTLNFSGQGSNLVYQRNVPGVNFIKLFSLPN